MSDTPSVTRKSEGMTTRIKAKSLIRKKTHRISRRLGRFLFRHRFLALFTVFGVLSLTLEVTLIHLLPDVIPLGARKLIGFIAGMIFAGVTNATLNFKVPPKRLVWVLMLFALVSCLSYSTNIGLQYLLHDVSVTSYPVSRFASSGVLFLAAYWVHRKFTFREDARDLGLAVYLADSTDVTEIYTKVGDLADHIHLDLVDETFRADAQPVELQKLDDVMDIWPDLPRHVHIMSSKPSRYMEQLVHKVDAVLVHVNIEEDIYDILAQCRAAGTAFGVVWHQSVTMADLIPYLPHADFVLVLGIAEPGASGQSLVPEALENAHLLAKTADRYGYRLIFDGGVNAETVHRIPAPLIVSSSSVLRAEHPFFAIIQLTGAGVRP